jgi:hypothetical protein
MKDWNIKRFTKAQPKNAFYQMARPARELFDHRPGATITKCCKDSHDLQHDLADMVASLHVRVGLSRVVE